MILFNFNCKTKNIGVPKEVLWKNIHSDQYTVSWYKTNTKISGTYFKIKTNVCNISLVQNDIFLFYLSNNSTYFHVQHTLILIAVGLENA